MKERQDDLSSPEYDVVERDSLAARFEFEAIVNVLKTRFSDYSDETSILASISPSLDRETLRQIFKIACLAPSFKNFCDELSNFWTSRDAKNNVVDEERRLELVTAQLFNNFIVQILEKRRRIGAAFLNRYVGEISPTVAQELDFDAYSTEPTVHIFGAQVSRLCDLIFSIPFKDPSKGIQAVVVPMEHKSTQTRNVVFQLLMSLVLVLQYILRHKERFQRNDKKFVWPFLLLFYTGARSWEKVLNFPDLFATPNSELDKSWIFRLPFKFVSLFKRKKCQIKDDPWLDAFLELTTAAEKIVAKKDATAEDWEKAWNDALKALEGKLDATDQEEPKIYGDFIVFISKVSVRQGWNPPTREEITSNLEKLGGYDMQYKIDSLSDVFRIQIERESEQRNVRKMLKQCIDLRFPRISQTMLNGILSITDVNILESIFSVACTSDSLDKFQKGIQGIAPVN